MRERVNPRVNRDLPKQELPDPGQRDERAEDLHLTFQSEGWKNTVVPGLKIRLAELENRMATDRNMTQETWRVLQAQHALLSEIVADPVHFFLREIRRQ